MWALAQSGVPFRTIVHEDGTVERWQQPKLPAWEVPKRNPHERRPRAPAWEPKAAKRDDAAGAATPSTQIAQHGSSLCWFAHRSFPRADE
jgi:hypothetical protein